MLRIFIGESHRHEDKPLYVHLVEFCKKNGIAGATVFRGILGYGKSSIIHKAGILSFSSDLPILVEVIDCEEKINKVLPHLSGLIKDGLITLEKVKIVKT